MKKPDSITLMLMGTGLIPVALIMGNIVLKSILLVASIIMNILAVVRNFREKQKKNM